MATQVSSRIRGGATRGAKLSIAGGSPSIGGTPGCGTGIYEHKDLWTRRDANLAASRSGERARVVYAFPTRLHRRTEQEASYGIRERNGSLYRMRFRICIQPAAGAECG